MDGSVVQLGGKCTLASIPKKDLMAISWFGFSLSFGFLFASNSLGPSSMPPLPFAPDQAAGYGFGPTPFGAPPFGAPMLGAPPIAATPLSQQRLAPLPFQAPQDDGAMGGAPAAHAPWMISPPPGGKWAKPPFAGSPMPLGIGGAGVADSEGQLHVRAGEVHKPEGSIYSRVRARSPAARRTSRARLVLLVLLLR